MPHLHQIGALLLLTALVFVAHNTLSAIPSRRIKNISYLTTTTPDTAAERHLLDVYTPRKKSEALRPVVVFIHGGNWTSGKKDIYWFIGRRLAKQGVVAVVINYRLSPAVQVPAMANDCARAVQWTTQHIAEYGGDPSRIYVMGHSAGGGLAALLATDDKLFTDIGVGKNPVKGAILNDPAGINMYDYLLKMEYPNDKQYLTSFGRNPEGWRDASPLYKVRPGLPPMLLYTGERTYPSIIAGTKALQEKLQAVGVQSQYRIIPRKKHVPMVAQMFWKRNVIYRDLLVLVK
ncbi:alpha/beta hydrolase [Spirosoma montaniterrae]|uniref:Alpha/beta hydrolase n=1 Tax=Spirosoma montaniterrae TaxID=1178516 RepID=A0A1P9WW27_9BACT|nr:alpha/beta hydrolase [Spirosoma montaniterrae]AQG79587.1 alpha/beta hydrolase [Spirosoma montaniterrae]